MILGIDPGPIALISVLGIDPGPIESHYALLSVSPSGVSIKCGTFENEGFADVFRGGYLYMAPHACIEQIASYGMSAGADLFETCFWTGRFYEWLSVEGLCVFRAKRKTIAAHHCHDAKAKDGNVRQAMIDRFGPPYVKGFKERVHKKTGAPLAPKKVRLPGPTHGITKDQWQALAVAAYAHDVLKKVPA